jgi:hypothetical protein
MYGNTKTRYHGIEFCVMVSFWGVTAECEPEHAHARSGKDQSEVKQGAVKPKKVT